MKSEMEAFVSLATNDSYSLGALVLAQSLRNAGTLKKLALLITRDVSMDMRHRLERVWDELVLVEELDSCDSEHLSLLTRPELGVTFSKIHAWRLTQYTKCVFLDADAMVLQNVDVLFEREELSAAPDIGWPDCFNSGVFVFEPSLETFSSLFDLARQRGSFDGGDQGLLNTYWGDWATKDIKYHLPFIYNVTPNITYGYAPAFQRFGQNIKIIHFIGSTKPWQHHYNTAVDSVVLSPGTYSSEHASQDFIRQWWQLHNQLEQPRQPSFDWSSFPLAPPSSHSLPPSSYYTPSPPSSHYTPLHYTRSYYSSSTPSHNTSHTRNSSTNHSSNNYSPTPVYLPSDVVPDSSTPITPYYYHHSFSEPETPRPAPVTHSDHHSHTSLSFYSHDALFQGVSDSLPIETPTPTGSEDFCNDVEEFTARIYKKLNRFLLEDEPTVHISSLYSSDRIFVCPPTSANSSQGIHFPRSLSQSNYSFMCSNNPDTESDADSLPESVLSDDSVSPPSFPFEEGGVGTVKLSDSVCTNAITPPPTYAHHPLSTVALPPRDNKESSQSRQEESCGQHQALAVYQTTSKTTKQANFERGQIEYYGLDSFANIQAHIDKMLK